MKLDKKTGLGGEESALFRQAMRGVKPLAPHPKVTAPPPPAKRPLLRAAEKNIAADFPFSDHESQPPVGGEDLLAFARPGLQHKVLRKLRQGQYNVEGILDLHGKTVLEARAALSQFLLTCRQKRARHVLIIHGKGLDKQKTILKNKINHWLRQTEQVLAFCSAMRAGRGGALYVLLRSQSLAEKNHYYRHFQRIRLGKKPACQYDRQ